MVDEHVPMLIIGGGPAGLMAALLLARAGVKVQLVERRSGTSFHPRARGLNVRTMEILRELELEELVREAGAALELSHYMLFVETLAGHEIRRVIDDDLVATGDTLAAFTPCAWCQCAQDKLEPILLNAACQNNADVRFNSEVISLTQDADGVDVSVRDRQSGEQRTIRAQYVIAADGARSMVREALDIAWLGHGMFGSYVNIYFCADLRELVRDRWFGICFVENPATPGLFLAVNNTDRWLFNAEYDPSNGASPADFTPERCLQLVRGAVGIPDLDVKILSVLPWEASARIAEPFQVGRVFLAGDAAHVMPPAGGFGLNTGVQDAHNLAWKLAAVLRGEADPALLNTYDVERQAAARLIIGDAVREMEAPTPDTPGRPGGPPQGLPDGDDDGPPYGPPGGGDPTAMLVPVLSYHYASQAIVPDGTEPQFEGLDLSGRPGTRAPHVWLEQNGQRISSLDLFGDGFVLLAGSEGAAWREAAHAAGEQMNIKLAAYRISSDGDICDQADEWHEVYGISPSGAVLVRPDGFVAWRSHDSGEAPIQQLTEVLRMVLGLSTARRDQ